MSNALRNRVILLALVILIGQLTLVVHATVHDAEINCQLCLSQSHHAKGIPVVNLDIPLVRNIDGVFISTDILLSLKPFPNAFSQRAPPVTV